MRIQDTDRLICARSARSHFVPIHDDFFFLVPPWQTGNRYVFVQNKSLMFDVVNMVNV